MKEKIETSVIESDESGKIISINNKPIQTISINIDGLPNGEEWYTHIKNHLLKNPKAITEFADSLNHLKDYSVFCHALAERETWALRLLHFTKLSMKKIIEATGFTEQEIQKIDKEFWKDEIDYEETLSEEDQCIINECLKENTLKNKEDLLKDWFRN